MRFAFRFALAPAACLLFCHAPADTLVLSNGDRLSGTVKSLWEGTIQFQSDLAGAVKIPWDKIASLQMDRDAEIVIGGTTTVGRIESRSDGTVWLISADRPRRIEFRDVSAIDPPEPLKPTWRGSVASNLNFTRSNSDNRVFNVSADASRRGSSDEIAASATYLYGEQRQAGSGQVSTTQDSWSAQGQYSRFHSDQFFGFGSLRLERDGIASLNLRSIVGGGAGFMLLRKGKTEVWGELGVSHLREEFAGSTGSSERLTGQLSYRLRTELLRRVELAHEVAFFPALDQPENYYLSSKLTIRTPLAENLFANFRFVYDYDATPAPGARNDSSKYTFGIGYRF